MSQSQFGVRLEEAKMQGHLNHEQELVRVKLETKKQSVGDGLVPHDSSLGQMKVGETWPEKMRWRILVAKWFE